jgi:hypothetical protein
MAYERIHKAQVMKVTALAAALHHQSITILSSF